MQRLNSLVLTTFILFSSGFVGKSMPAFSAEPQMNALTNMQTKGKIKADGEAEILAKLNLTTDQKRKITTLTINTYQKVVPILTPEQRKKVESGLRSRQGLSSIVRDLNLTPSQNTKINPIIIDYKKQVLTVLTPEQKQQIESLAPKK